MPSEWGVFNTKINKIIRSGFTEDQADSFISVHISDCNDDKKKPWLMKVYKNISAWYYPAVETK